MRTVIEEKCRELLSTEPQVSALVAAIKALDDSDDGCVIDAIINTSDEPQTTTLVVGVGPNHKKFIVRLADLDEDSIQKICHFVSEHRNASALRTAPVVTLATSSSDVPDLFEAAAKAIVNARSK